MPPFEAPYVATPGKLSQLKAESTLATSPPALAASTGAKARAIALVPKNRVRAA